MTDAFGVTLADAPLYDDYDDEIPHRLALVDLDEWEHAEVQVPDPFASALRRPTLRRYDLRNQLAQKVEWPGPRGDLPAMSKVFLDLVITEIATTPHRLPDKKGRARDVLDQALFVLGDENYMALVTALGWADTFKVNCAYVAVHDRAKDGLIDRLTPRVVKLGQLLRSAQNRSA